MSDNERCFVDTNVLLYLYSGTEKDKQQRAQEYVDNCECVISTQVLNEFSNVCITLVCRIA
jgi:predicted nucleic acid-binding protein